MMPTLKSQNTADTVSALPKSPAKAAAAKDRGQTSKGRFGKTSKKDQLATLISMPDGARISILVERLGWQSHTVRAALSGLRKQGYQILASKSQQTGEAVYQLIPAEAKSITQLGEAAS